MDDKIMEKIKQLEKEIADKDKKIQYIKDNYISNYKYQHSKNILSAIIASSVLIFNIKDFSLSSTIIYFIGSIILFIALICLIVDEIIEFTMPDFLSERISILSPFIIIAIIYIVAFLNYHDFFKQY